jgi:flagellar protein FlaG
MEHTRIDQAAQGLPPTRAVTAQKPPPPEDGGGDKRTPRIIEASAFEPTIDPEELHVKLEEKIQEINTQLKDGGRGLSFAIDEQLGRAVVTVKKANSGEVIRQIPGEVVLRIGHHIEKLKGLLFEGRS